MKYVWTYGPYWVVGLGEEGIKKPKTLQEGYLTLKKNDMGTRIRDADGNSLKLEEVKS